MIKPMKKSDFPARLRTLREAAGLKRYQLDQAAGLSAGAVSALEKGRNAPTLETARKLAAALGEKSLACWD